MNSSTRQDDMRFLELLQRWISGDFTRAHEQELRKLIHADAFRREAMEGFMTVPEADHAALLESLRNRLNPPGRSRIVPMPQILAIAAGLALLIGVLVFFPEQTAQQSEEMAVQSAPQPDSTAVAMEQAPVASAPENQDVAATTPPLRSRAARDEAGPEPGTYSAESLKKDQMSDLEQDQNANLAGAEEKAQLEKPVQKLPPVDDRRKELAKTKTESYEVENAQRSQSDIPSTPNNVVTSRPGDQAKAKKYDKAGAPQNQAATASQPAGGWGEFQEYIRRNARLTDEARNNNVSGTVILLFDVNDEGKPVNIKVTRSLGHGCDEEAIRLLEAWRWTPSAAPVTVSIPFVR